MNSSFLKSESLHILTLCLLLIGIPLCWHSANDMNPDTYQYMAMANYYLQDPSPVIRDVMTVGPVIPLVIAGVNYLFLKLSFSSPAIDIFSVKTIVLCCYFSLFMFSYKVLIRSCSERIAFFVLYFLMIFLPIEWDTMSLNGEMICVALLVPLIYFVDSDSRNMLREIVLAVLPAFIIYTKIQSAPLVLLILMYGFVNDKLSCRIIAGIFFVTLILELVLYVNGIGVLKNIYLYYNYVVPWHAEAVKPGSHGFLSYGYQALGKLYYLIKGRFDHINWVFAEITRYFLVFVVVITLLLLDGCKKRESILSNWVLWLVVTLFIIWLPGRGYSHYVMFAIPFIVKFAGPVFNRFEDTFNGHTKKFVIIATAFLLIFVKLKPYAHDMIHFNVSSVLQRNTLSLGKSMEDVRSIVAKSKGNVLIHGWDYKFYVYLKSYYPMVKDIPWLIHHDIDEQNYTQMLDKNKFYYILDIVGSSGILRDPRYSLINKKAWRFVMDKTYDVVYQQNGLVLYRIK